MTTATSKVTPQAIVNYGTAMLAKAQVDFYNNPNSVNWQATLKAMFVYQQVQYLVNRGSLLGIYELAKELDDLSWHLWDDAISVHATGHSVSDALAYTA